MTPDPEIERVFEEARKADIEAVAGVKLWRAGGRLRGECPLCGGSKGKRADGCFSADPRKGVFHCWKCDRSGDVITLEHALRSSADESRLDAARRLTGSERRRPINEPVREELKRASDFSARIADRLWEEARIAASSPVEAYLANRGIADWPIALAVKNLRFHPNAYHSGPWREATRFPAMIGRLKAPEGFTGGIHVTYLAPGAWTKAPIAPAKKMWGPQTLNLQRGGVWLHGPVGRGPLVIGEGIETSLAAAQLASEEPCRIVAALSLGGLQGGWMLDQWGRLDPDVVRPDPERSAFTWPLPTRSAWPEVLIAVDRDMTPVPVKVRKLGGGTYTHQLVADERARICGSLAKQCWVRTGIGKVRIIAPGPGRDFVDEIRERTA